MAKKQEFKKVSPSECVTSLRMFNENVVGLVTMLPLVVSYLKKGDINASHSQSLYESLQSHIDTLNEFYES